MSTSLNLTTEPPARNGSGSPSVRLQRVNGADLLREALDPSRPSLRFLPLLGQGGFFVEGFSHLLSGFPKAGKTTLLAHLVLGWGKAGKRILYLTEEPRLAWEQRLQVMPHQGWGNANFIFALGCTQKDLRQVIEAGDEEIVIVDTLRLLGIEDENDNAQMNRAITPFIVACRTGRKTLIFAHHTRKAGGDYGAAAAGGHALIGVVDVVLELHRDGPAASRRVVKGWGRIVDIPELLYEKQGADLIPIGSPHGVALATVKDRLKRALFSEWQKTADLLGALGEPQPSDEQVRKALEDMAAAGEIERNPPINEGSKPGATYKWRQPPTSSDLKGRSIGGEVAFPPAPTSSNDSVITIGGKVFPADNPPIWLDLATGKVKEGYIPWELIPDAEEDVQAGVSEETYATVFTVEMLLFNHREPVTVNDIALWLQLDKSSAARRVNRAISEGYLENKAGEAAAEGEQGVTNNGTA